MLPLGFPYAGSPVGLSPCSLITVRCVFGNYSLRCSKITSAKALRIFSALWCVFKIGNVLGRKGVVTERFKITGEVANKYPKS
ncbi:hypothetical protein DP116_00290 [Brasilonema bromeliae SPC951]|uniref:Uncharacterized protein n=1 Tax=Brasilonema bromeliae SPC951 TaxID=385972 RepID=A0ABX1P0Y0_9CYAN|nr:hypothetical protein [Brasilonema bromeliae SPC951]